MKQRTIAAIVIIFLALLAIVFYFGAKNAPTLNPQVEVTALPLVPGGAKDTTYLIEGEQVKLTGGKAEKEAAPGSASKITTSVFGELTLGDVNADGQNDAALILVQNGGGSGTFYYLAVAYSSSTGIIGTNTLLLGDRIAPQSVEIRNGMVIVNYATRRPDEPMSVQPSQGVSLYARLAKGVLVDVTKEANSASDSE